MANDDSKGMGESPQQGFEIGVDAHTAIYDLTLRSYEFCCALTGTKFDAPRLQLHDRLDVVALRPLDDGGPLSINNCIPMRIELKRPFLAGYIAIEDDLRIRVLNEDHIERQLLGVVLAKLQVPDDVLLRPASEFLAYHRRYALGR